jgi:hypothetical protein
MNERLEYFGGMMHVRMTVEERPSDVTWFDREFWFDRDIDGRWLVGVTGTGQGDEDDLGAIVVKDKTIIAFIESLGNLIANPAQFSGEPVLFAQAGNGPAAEG